MKTDSCPGPESRRRRAPGGSHDLRLVISGGPYTMESDGTAAESALCAALAADVDQAFEGLPGAGDPGAGLLHR